MSRAAAARSHTSQHTLNNLITAMKAEAFEAGDREAAERFEVVRQDEIEHRDLFRAALEKLPPTG